MRDAYADELHSTAEVAQQRTGQQDLSAADEDLEDEDSNTADSDETVDPSYQWPQRKLQFRCVPHRMTAVVFRRPAAVDSVLWKP